jgi:hypothetical protein
MTDYAKYDEHDPRHHTQRLKQMLKDTAAHAREDVQKVSDPKANGPRARPLMILNRRTKKRGRLQRSPQIESA